VGIDVPTEVLNRLAGRENNEAQELNLELMRIASFNNYDGEKVVRSLRRNRGLWRAVTMDMEGYSHICLIKLRDLPDNCWNVSTVFILSVAGKEEQLFRIVRRWRADEVNWINEEEASKMLGSFPAPSKILRVWWD